MQSKALLLEIGVEELPASYVDAALVAMPMLFKEQLEQLRIKHGLIVPLGTPRRLSIIVEDVADAQTDLDEEVIGPPESAGFKDGHPTKAAVAFAQKIGIQVSDLRVIEREALGKQKAGRYLVGRRIEKGKSTQELMGQTLARLCERIPFRKSMRWADLDVTFGRPVQWLVALFGHDVIDMTFAGVRSGRITRGHRFLSPDPFEIRHSSDYISALRARHVLVDRAERERVMMERVTEAASKAGGTHDPEPSLIAENASLVEEPHVVIGSFESQFLELPAAVIRSVARGHQKYFCVQENDDTLLAHYIAVVNTAEKPEIIAKGNDRVMRARLADARFFFEEDKKARIEDRIEKLGGIVFHNRLGTVQQKVARVRSLAADIADQLGFLQDEKTRVARAAELCKFDLVSLMVGEFPELQGHMGRAYAQNGGEDQRVADAIRDHYKPIGASDDVARDAIAVVIALADRLDTLVGCFSVGLSPTGAADPYALRRACIAMLRILIESSASVSSLVSLRVPSLVELAYKALAGTKVRTDLTELDLKDKLYPFIEERLRGVLSLATSNAVGDAVLSDSCEKNIEFPAHAMIRARALHDAVTSNAEWLDKARIVAKRLSGISKEASPILHDINAFVGSAKDDTRIVHVVKTARERTTSLDSEQAVRRALAHAATLASELDAIFTSTLINDPNDAFTKKRLEVLSFGAQCMNRLADFSRLA